MVFQGVCARASIGKVSRAQDLPWYVPSPRTGPEEWGPLVRQSAPAAHLARAFNHAAQELWDTCTYTDSAQMWEEARAIASRILASCPGD